MSNKKALQGGASQVAPWAELTLDDSISNVSSSNGSENVHHSQPPPPTTSLTGNLHHNEQTEPKLLDLMLEKLERLSSDINMLLTSHGQLLDELRQLQVVDRKSIPAGWTHLLCANCDVRPIEKMSRDCPRDEGHLFCSDCIERARGKRRQAICPKCARHTRFIKICRPQTPHLVE